MKEALAMIVIIICIFGIACIGIAKIGQPKEVKAIITPNIPLERK